MDAKLKTVLFCGHRSPYGIAHLEPIAREFDLRAVVVADDARWRQFREKLAPAVLPCETPLRKLRRELGGVLRAPQRARGERVLQARLRAAGAPVIVANNANDPSLLERLRELGAHVVLSAAYPQIFGEALVRLAPRGAVNFHPSLLPRFRGAHPHYWCLAMGEDCGGVTAHFMTERIDDGDILVQRAFALDGLYYAELYERIVAETPALVSDVAAFLRSVDAKSAPQDESKATVFRNDRDVHHRISWSAMSAVAILNRIRAGSAFATFRGYKVVFTRAHVADRNRNMTNGVVAEPGVIVDLDESGIWTASQDKKFVVIESLLGRRGIEAFRVWVAKRDLKVGERFD